MHDSFGVPMHKPESPRRLLGRRGEEMAAAHLCRKGYAIIAANWRCARGELDLVARDRATLVFVEVRTRRTTLAGSAAESITLAKQRRLALLARAYLERVELDGQAWSGPWRIDVVAIELPAHGAARIVHLVSAIEELEAEHYDNYT